MSIPKTVLIALSCLPLLLACEDEGRDMSLLQAGGRWQVDSYKSIGVNSTHSYSEITYDGGWVEYKDTLFTAYYGGYPMDCQNILRIYLKNQDYTEPFPQGYYEIANHRYSLYRGPGEDTYRYAAAPEWSVVERPLGGNKVRLFLTVASKDSDVYSQATIELSKP